MYKKLLVILACIFGFVQMWANPVTADQAREKAGKFLNGRMAPRARAAAPVQGSLTLAAVGDEESYYIFNIGSQDGYVVVSGEDDTEEILAFADQGAINPEAMPDNMKALMQDYANQIKWLRANRDKVSRSIEEDLAMSDVMLDVEKLARWGQNEPFNKHCPIINDQLSLTGCGPTAMAQVLYYHKSPAVTKAEIPSHLDGISSVAAGTVLEWDKMDNTGAECAEEDAAAWLSLYCGLALHATYKVVGENKATSSYVEDMPYAFAKYFGYSSSLMIERNNYTNSDWMRLIYNELKRGNPVIYRGIKEIRGGHVFLLEGYSGGLFYVNWGCDTFKNGFYRLSILDNYTLRDDYMGAIDYHRSQAAIVGLYPDKAPSNYSASLTIDQEMEIEDYELKRSSADEAFPAFNVKAHLANYNPARLSFESCLGMFDSPTTADCDPDYEGKSWWRVTSIMNTNFEIKAAGFLTFNVELPSDIADGEYYIAPIARENGSGSNLLVSLDADKYFLKLIVNGNTLKLRPTAPEPANLKISGFAPKEGAVIREGKPFIITCAITNNGESTYTGELMVYSKEANNEKYYYSSIYVTIEPGDMQEVEFEIVPKTSGWTTLRLSDKDNYEIAYVEINAKAAEKLKVETIELYNRDSEDNAFYGTTLAGNVKLTNLSSQDNDQSVVIYLYENGEMLTGRRYPIDIEANKTGSAKFEFDGVVPGHSYSIHVGYSDLNEFYSSDNMLCKEKGDTRLSGDANGDNTVNVADIVEAINAAKDGTESNADLEKIVNHILGKEIEIPRLSLSYNKVYIEAGQQATIAIESGCGKYTVIAYDPNVAKVELDGSTITVTALMAGRTVVHVTDEVSGRRVPFGVEVKEPEHQAVDLGLPSGTKWASCNIGALVSEGYGLYFAWGETTGYVGGSHSFIWDNYKWMTQGRNSWEYINKYQTTDNKTEGCWYNYSGKFIGDGKRMLELDDDPARRYWGDNWGTPTYEDLTELLANTTNEWTTENGVYGMRFTSTVNGNSIFLPAAGYCSSTSTIYPGEGGYYWTASMPYLTRSARCLAFTAQSNDNMNYNYYKNLGMPVRPVLRDFNLELSSYAVYVEMGRQAELTVTSGSGTYSLWIYAPEVATAEIKGNTITVNAVSKGKTIIRVIDERTGKHVTFGVEVKPKEGIKPIDLGLPSGTKWSSCNVGAELPEEYGELYAWGETAPKTIYDWAHYSYSKGSEETITKYNATDGKYILELMDDAAHMNVGKDWRTPTYEEMNELKEKCQWTYETLYGVPGYRVTGPNGNSIFLPSGGQKYDKEWVNKGSVGYYTTATRNSTGYAPGLCIYSKQQFLNYARYMGMSVRPVLRNADEQDQRLETVVPEQLRLKLEKRMPIYDGNHPPKVEGVFKIKPYQCVYCEDGVYSPGYNYGTEIIRFSNFNEVDNTLDYSHYFQNKDEFQSGTGAFISGNGNYFTAYFISEGATKGVTTKQASIISGEVTDDGLKNVYSALLMLEKGDDPYRYVMKEGYYRIYKDGDTLSEPCEWEMDW